MLELTAEHGEETDFLYTSLSNTTQEFLKLRNKYDYLANSYAHARTGLEDKILKLQTEIEQQGQSLKAYKDFAEYLENSKNNMKKKYQMWLVER